MIVRGKHFYKSGIFFVAFPLTIIIILHFYFLSSSGILLITIYTCLRLEFLEQATLAKYISSNGSR